MIEGANVEDFYLTLPSNSSFPFYGDQHPSHYKTKLNSRVSLDPAQWSLGLASISYPKSWANVERVLFRVALPPVAGRDDVLTASIEGKLYVSAEHLIREIQWAIKECLPSEHAGKIRIRYDAVSNRARVVAERGYYLWLPRKLMIPLGFASKDGLILKADVGPELVEGLVVPGNHIPTPFARAVEERDGHTVEEGLYTANPDRSLPRIYAYCDIVERQLVGDAHVPLLRILDVPCNVHGDVVTHQFTNIHYVDLQRGSFEAVEVKLVDSLGTIIPFKHGNVVVKIHFRKKRR